MCVAQNTWLLHAWLLSSLSSSSGCKLYSEHCLAVQGGLFNWTVWRWPSPSDWRVKKKPDVFVSNIVCPHLWYRSLHQCSAPVSDLIWIEHGFTLVPVRAQVSEQPQGPRAWHYLPGSTRKACQHEQLSTSAMSTFWTKYRISCFPMSDNVRFLVKIPKSDVRYPSDELSDSPKWEKNSFALDNSIHLTLFFSSRGEAQA